MPKLKNKAALELWIQRQEMKNVVNDRRARADQAFKAALEAAQTLVRGTDIEYEAHTALVNALETGIRELWEAGSQEAKMGGQDDD